MDQYIKKIMSQHKYPASQPAPAGADTRTVSRPESMVFTGLPKPDMRPSLPVTPAPIVTDNFWGGDQASAESERNGIIPSTAPAPSEWVCPQCGFSSRDLAVFIPPQSRNAISLAQSEPEDLLDDKVDKEMQNHMQTLVESESPPQPAIRHRQSSSIVSHSSGGSTAVPYNISASLEPTTSPARELHPDAKPEALPGTKSLPQREVKPRRELEPMPTPKLQPEPKPQFLPPPAWLTAKVSHAEPSCSDEAHQAAATTASSMPITFDSVRKYGS